MPLYEYECQQCRRHTEKIQKFSDPEITQCPHCGGHLERVISAPAIAFKGGGWYADGYGNAKPAASGESKGEAKSDAGASAGSSEGSGKTAASGGENANSSSPSPSAPSSPATAPAPSTPAKS